MSLVARRDAGGRPSRRRMLLIVGAVLGLVAVVAATALLTGSLVTTRRPAPGVVPLPSASALPSGPAPSVPPPASPTPAGTPTPLPAGVFGVLEARGAPQHNVAAIVLPDGSALAKTTFKPRQVPTVGNAAPLLASEGVVAAGALYFADGDGVVRRLTPDGQAPVVATFALTKQQQMLSFAVSPDGARLVAARLSLPVVTWPPPSPAPASPAPEPYVLEVLTAPAYGATSLLHSWQSPDSPDQAGGGLTMLRLVGWDANGPLALVGAMIGTQYQAWDRQELYGGAIQNLDLKTGLPVGAVVGQCAYSGGLKTDQPWSVSPAGTVVCPNLNGTVAVLRADGSLLFQTGYPKPGYLGGAFALSPDEQHLAMDYQVTGVDAQVHQLLQGFRPAGWIDATTVIGEVSAADLAACGPDYQLATMKLGAVMDAELGFCGRFLGALT